MFVLAVAVCYPRFTVCGTTSQDSLQHLICDVQRAVEGLIIQSRIPNGPEEFYGTLSKPTQVGKSVLYVIQTLVGDAFVVRIDVAGYLDHLCR